MNNQVYQLALSTRKETGSLIPGNDTEFLQMDYDWLCSSVGTQSEIDAGIFNDFIAKGDVDVIDVREPGEMPAVSDFPHIKIPLAQLPANITSIKSDTIIAFCQSGKRSLQAVKILSGIFGATKKIYSLRGGILEWKKQKLTR